MSKPASWLRGVLVVLAGLAGLLAWQQGDLGRWLTLEQLRASHTLLIHLYENQPLRFLVGFGAVYVLATALSIPGATILTLAAGAIFGLGTGLVLVSFTSSLGALLAFLVSRHLLRGWVTERFGARLAPIHDGVARDGTFYLLTLRLIPVFPFWLVNLLMGLTAMPARRFLLVSQIGMLPGTAIYVNAGTQLAAIRSTADILSPGVFTSLVLLGLFPLLARSLVARLRLHRHTAHATRFARPKTFERNLVVIGAGAGGLVTAYIAAAVRARVTLIERHRMGGDCLNTGCVPSKALIRAAHAAHQLKQAEALGLTGVQGTVDFAAVMRRVHHVIDTIAPHDSAARYTALGVEVLSGQARITSPWTVEVTLADGTPRTLTTRNIVVATGSSPRIPALPGLQESGFLTSDTVWSLTERPHRLLVLGGGPIGCELAQSFARLGSTVTQVEPGQQVLNREDPEAGALVAAALRADGVDLRLGHEPLRVERIPGAGAADRGHPGPAWQLIVAHDGVEHAIAFDRILCAVGRVPRTAGFGLEALGIPLTAQGAIETGPGLATRYPNIFAVGDVAGHIPLTHAAAHQAWHAAVNALFGRFKTFRVDHTLIPRVTFTDPEVAQVGLTEHGARAQGIPFEATRYGLEHLDRAITDDTARGFVKVLTVPGKDRILGVTIVGHHAGELLAQYALAMKHGLGLNRILGTVHAYPTFSEANKNAAGQWKRAHAPQRVLRWLERFHAWERS